MTYEEILYETQHAVATITLNRPAKLNAWTFAMERELRHAFADAAADDAVRVIVLRGAGRAFCAGADMGTLDALIADPTLATRPPPDAAELPSGTSLPPHEEFLGRYSYIASISKPVIAAIHGPCIGIGLVLSLFCDIRIASTEAKFGLPFSRLGLVAEHGTSWMLPRIVGLPMALEMFFTADTIDAVRAATSGLVSRVAPVESFDEDVCHFARRLADQVSPRSLGIIKRQVYRDLYADLSEALAVANEQMEQCFVTEDFREGIAHFIEKRAPRFTGR